MRMSEALRRTGSAARSGARLGARATRGTGRFVHRVTGASGAGLTGLATLIELSAASGAGDAFVVVALAGTIFFDTSVDQARGKVVLFLLVTMAPFAVLAPFIGPALDRVQQGRKYLLAGTLLARGLLCWGMAAAVSSPITLLPSAFGVLVLQKAYGVVRASVAPRLLPEQITLVAANARSQLIMVIGSMVAAAVAEGVQVVAGAAWVLRAGMVVYLAAMILALRLPDRVDSPPASPSPCYAPAGTIPLEAPRPGTGRHWRTLRTVGPVVAEAMSVNTVLRAFSGYTFFFFAFLLQSVHFGVSKHVALAALAFAVAAGSAVAMAIGSVLRSRAPQLIMYAVLTVAPVVAAAAAWLFGLVAVMAVAFAAICCASLAKLAQDSIVQREIGDELRSSAFGVSETLNQVANVAGGLFGVLVSMLGNGQAGLAIAAAFLAAALVGLVGRRRRRILARRRARPPRRTPPRARPVG